MLSRTISVQALSAHSQMNGTGTVKPYETLAGADDKAAAKKLFGRIGTVMRDRVAFETLRVRRALSAIELPEDADIADFEKVFGDLDQVEAAEYHRIAKSRLDVIERFRQLAPEARERV